jgi:hypothetical protein
VHNNIFSLIGKTYNLKLITIGSIPIK